MVGSQGSEFCAGPCAQIDRQSISDPADHSEPKYHTLFRNDRGVSLVQLADLRQSIVFRRMEDEGNKISLPTLLLRQKRSWTILIHERLLDYMAHVLAFRSEFKEPAGAVKERGMLKFFELLLRHHFEHLVFPGTSELDVIRSDIEFAAAWGKKDPKDYQAFLGLLSNPANGIIGKNYVELLEGAKRREDSGFRLGRIVAAYAGHIAQLPASFLMDIFPDLDLQIKLSVLNQTYRNSRISGEPLSKSTAALRKVLRLLAMTIHQDSSEGMELFKTFIKRWGTASLFKELDVSPSLDRERPLPQLFEIFKKNLEAFVESEDITTQQGAQTVLPQPVTDPAPPQTKSLKERIDEARTDPDIPQAVTDLIEKNKMNAAGQSGAKYTELIETLLAIPWGKIKQIRVTPDEFDEGLNRSHYGLKIPKEIISDFFANLIWRYQHFKESEKMRWHRTGSALLFVVPREWARLLWRFPSPAISAFLTTRFLWAA